MMTNTHLPRSVRFANFELNTQAGELWTDNRKVHLQEKPLQILMMLIERAGDVVTRQELHKALWPGSTFGDLEDSLNHAMRRLREGLGDTSEHPRLIETLPRHGYRFIAPLEEGAMQVPLPTGHLPPVGDDDSLSPPLKPPLPSAPAVAAVGARPDAIGDPRKETALRERRYRPSGRMLALAGFAGV